MLDHESLDEMNESTMDMVTEWASFTADTVSGSIHVQMVSLTSCKIGVSSQSN